MCISTSCARDKEAGSVQRDGEWQWNRKMARQATIQCHSLRATFANFRALAHANYLMEPALSALLIGAKMSVGDERVELLLGSARRRVTVVYDLHAIGHIK